MVDWLRLLRAAAKIQHRNAILKTSFVVWSNIDDGDDDDDDVNDDDDDKGVEEDDDEGVEKGLRQGSLAEQSSNHTTLQYCAMQPAYLILHTKYWIVNTAKWMLHNEYWILHNICLPI